MPKTYHSTTSVFSIERFCAVHTGRPRSWAVFTTDSDLSLEAHAVRERVEKRMSVLGEKLWGNGEVVWIGNGRLDDVLYRRDEAAPEISVVYGAIDA